jgi:ubiquinol-cytochrome c reductase cytochrome b subunit
MVFFAVVFFAPEGGGYFLEANNFVEADPLKTPAHIAPVWYFTPFYSMLRATTDLMVDVLCATLAVLVAAILVAPGATVRRKALAAFAMLAAIALLRTLDAKFWGVVVMAASVLVLLFLPWLDRSPVRSIRYRPRWHGGLFVAFAAGFLVLGTTLTQVLTFAYFAFFLAMPAWSRRGVFQKPPERVRFSPH